MMITLALLAALTIVWAGDYLMRMPGPIAPKELPPLAANERDLAEALERDVRVLSERIGPRSIYRHAALAEAADYIEDEFRNARYEPTRYALPEVTGEPLTYNIDARIPGKVDPNKVVILGAHYDSVAPTCPGANDNATGVAAVLALSRMFARAQPDYSIYFVAFTNEEPPYFMTERMGSRHYALQIRAEGREVIGMLSLETMGYFSSEQGSQRYPLPLLSWFYPSTGDFIGFVGNIYSAPLVRRSVRLFRENSTFPSEGIAAPAFVPGVAWSDQWSFWRQGYPALMVTDTAPFRYPHYHLDSDTWDKLDYESLARVVMGLKAVVENLTLVPS